MTWRGLQHFVIPLTPLSRYGIRISGFDGFLASGFWLLPFNGDSVCGPFRVGNKSLPRALR
jgi:hypothetical protein